MLFSFPCASLDPGLEEVFDVGDIDPARGISPMITDFCNLTPPPTDGLEFRVPNSQPVILAYLGILAVTFQNSSEAS